ncbi:MAG TPA: hypothetical protein VLE43_01835, partial [Candidatus Saccharimonadia bacterium]|nr:hypothetical protein [Candidatus Saccharimonadia bacterium]
GNPYHGNDKKVQSEIDYLHGTHLCYSSKPTCSLMTQYAEDLFSRLGRLRLMHQSNSWMADSPGIERILLVIVFALI